MFGAFNHLSGQKHLHNSFASSLVWTIMLCLSYHSNTERSCL